MYDHGNKQATVKKFNIIASQLSSKKYRPSCSFAMSLFGSTMNELKMHALVHHIVRVCYASLHNLWTIRGYLTTDAPKTLVQAIIMSHLDYSNSLLYGISVQSLLVVHGPKKKNNNGPVLSCFWIYPRTKL